MPKEISMFHPYDRIEPFPTDECEHIWIYRRFKGCITSDGEEPLVFEQKICRKCGKNEFGA